MKNYLREIGPGALVAAAFIGPGTVTTCTIAGANFGFVLLWAVVLSCLVTMFLQYSSAKLGLIARGDVATVVRSSSMDKRFKGALLILIFAAIVVGNLAYEAGNIRGAVLGLEPLSNLWGGTQTEYLVLFTALIAIIILLGKSYKILEKILIGLVSLMSLAFIIAMIFTKPSFVEILSGMFVVEVPENSLLTIMAVIGTTVVPYNIFLHGNLVLRHWEGPDDIAHVRFDTIFSIALGGLISLAIVVVAASVQGQSIKSGADLALGLGTVFGSSSTFLVSLGLFAAGLTSCITAPLAAAFVAANCLGWKDGMNSWRFRSVWLGIILAGMGFAMAGFQPIVLIQFAQITNAILLPVVVGILIWLTSKPDIMKELVNSTLQKTVGLIILVVSILLSVRIIYLLFF